MLLNAVIPAEPVPVPPLATAKVPAQVITWADPPETIVTLVSLVKVCAPAVSPFKEEIPPPDVITAETLSLFVVGSHNKRVGVLLESSVTASKVGTLF